MLFHIQTFDFFGFLNTQAEELIKNFKDNRHGNRNIDCYSNNTDNLFYQKISTAAIEEAAVKSEETGCDSTEGTTDTVNRNCTNRIINLQLLVEEFNSSDYQHTGNQADD